MKLETIVSIRLSSQIILDTTKIPVTAFYVRTKEPDLPAYAHSTTNSFDD